MAIEKRFIRIEDWEGNIYYPESNPSESTSGLIIDAAQASPEGTAGSTITTSGTLQTNVNGANKGTVIYLASDIAAYKNLITANFYDVPFGKVYIGLRLMCSIGSGTEPLFNITTYFNDDKDGSKYRALDSFTITGDMFEEAGVFKNFSFDTNYHGQFSDACNLKIEVMMIPGTGAVAYLDNITACRSLE